MSNLKIDSTVKLDSYKIISDSIQGGIVHGWNRAHKHIENPSKDHIMNQIHDCVMNALSEILKFD